MYNLSVCISGRSDIIAVVRNQSCNLFGWEPALLNAFCCHCPSASSFMFHASKRQTNSFCILTPTLNPHGNAVWLEPCLRLLPLMSVSNKEKVAGTEALVHQQILNQTRELHWFRLELISGEYVQRLFHGYDFSPTAFISFHLHNAWQVVVQWPDAAPYTLCIISQHSGLMRINLRWSQTLVCVPDLDMMKVFMQVFVIPDAFLSGKVSCFQVLWLYFLKNSHTAVMTKPERKPANVV